LSGGDTSIGAADDAALGRHSVLIRGSSGP